MSTKKEKKLVGEGDFTIIRETARYIESLSDNSFECGRLVGQSWRFVSVKNFEKKTEKHIDNFECVNIIRV